MVVAHIPSNCDSLSGEAKAFGLGSGKLSRRCDAWLRGASAKTVHVPASVRSPAILLSANWISAPSWVRDRFRPSFGRVLDLQHLLSYRAVSQKRRQIASLRAAVVHWRCTNSHPVTLPSGGWRGGGYRVANVVLAEAGGQQTQRW